MKRPALIIDANGSINFTPPAAAAVDFSSRAQSAALDSTSLAQRLQHI